MINELETNYFDAIQIVTFDHDHKETPRFFDKTLRQFGFKYTIFMED